MKKMWKDCVMRKTIRYDFLSGFRFFIKRAMMVFHAQTYFKTAFNNKSIGSNLALVHY